MKWPSLDLILKSISLPKGYQLAIMEPREVNGFVKGLQEWYPDISVGSESRFLKPSFYESSVFPPNSSFLPLLFKEEETLQISGWSFLEKNDDALSINSPMSGLVPSHRGKKGEGLAMLPPTLIETVGRIMGAELAYSFLTLSHIGAQRVAEKVGYQPVGIIPAFDRDMVSPGCIKRVYEVLYVKVLTEEDKIFYPPASSLTPGTRELWDFLFKKDLPS